MVNLPIHYNYVIFSTKRGKNTKLVLYTYDAFLFDLDDTEKDIIDELKEIFSSRELQIKYKCKFEWIENYPGV